MKASDIEWRIEHRRRSGVDGDVKGVLCRVGCADGGQLQVSITGAHVRTRSYFELVRIADLIIAPAIQRCDDFILPFRFIEEGDMDVQRGREPRK